MLNCSNKGITQTRLIEFHRGEHITTYGNFPVINIRSTDVCRIAGDDFHPVAVIFLSTDIKEILTACFLCTLPSEIYGLKHYFILLSNSTAHCIQKHVKILQY